MFTLNPKCVTEQPGSSKAGAWTVLGLPLLLVLQACAFKPFDLPEPLRRVSASADAQSRGEQNTGPSVTKRLPLLVDNAPTAPLTAASVEGGVVNRSDPKEAVSVTVEQMGIKAFVQLVFGNLLKKNVVLDQKVAARNDLITLKTEGQQTPRQVAETAKLLLQAFGITVVELDSLVSVIPSDAKGGELPLLRRGRASADTPMALRPIFHLVELEATRSSEAIGWAKSMFGTKVELQDDPNRNSILVSGTPDNVDAALQVIRSLDVPRMRGRIAKRITPAYLNSLELMTRLNELLAAQGYAVSAQGGASQGAAIVFVPVTSLNTLYAFTTNQAVAELVVRWASELDQPPASAAGSGIFRHEVRYADAKSLGETFNAMMQSQPAPAAGAAAAPGQAAASRGRVVVNSATNSLIIQGGSSDEHRQWRALLAELDRPIKSALIEVVVAEVALGAKEQLGVEWQLAGNRSVTGGTNVGDGLKIGSGGLSLSFLNNVGQVKAVLNALGSTNDARILSSPKLMARNAEAATIQVGQEVPIVTSQQSSSPIGTATTGGVLQSIQYRSTGVILRVKPVILAGGRIDLEVMQEVSSVAENRSGASISPTISSRKIETKLSMRDGGTVMLGGLISEATSRGDSRVPLLGDIPLLGRLFRVDNTSNDKTELIIMITAHVLNDDFEAEAITESFKNSLTVFPDRRPAVPLTKPLLERQDGSLNLPGSTSPAKNPAPASEEVSTPKPPSASQAVPVPKQVDPGVFESGQRGRAAPAPAGVVAPTLSPTAPASAGVATPSGSAAVPAPVAPLPGGAPAGARPVTDPKLIEELNQLLRQNK